MEISRNIFVTQHGLLIEKGLTTSMIIDSIWEMEYEVLEFIGEWFIKH